MPLAHIAAVMDVGLDLTESPPNWCGSGCSGRGRMGRARAEAGQVIAWPASAWLQRREASPRPAAAGPRWGQSEGRSASPAFPGGGDSPPPSSQRRRYWPGMPPPAEAPVTGRMGGSPSRCSAAANPPWRPWPVSRLRQARQLPPSASCADRNTA